MGKKIDIPEAKLRELYLDQNLSTRQIATMLGVGHGTIVNKCNEYGIKKDQATIIATRVRNVENTCLERYGCKSTLQVEDVQKRIKKTNLEKYGCDNPLKNEDVKNRVKMTNIERYGCDNPLKSEAIRKKTADTNLKRYGCENVFGNSEIQQKIKETNAEKYGYEYASQNDEIRAKQKATCVSRYGSECPLSNKDVQEKAKQTIRSRYDRDSFNQTHLSLNSLKIVSTAEQLCAFIDDNNIKTVSDLCEALGYSHSIMLKILHKFDLYNLLDHNESSPEQEVRDFINSLGVENYRDRSVFNGREIDIYCPKYKIGIEFNGVYWHSSLHKERDYHYQKSREAEAKGIRLIHIYENEWLDPRMQPIIKSLLSLAFGKIEARIYARQCDVREITNAEARDFVNENHIQGHRNAKVTLGLFYKDDLVQLMSFSHNKSYEWEIIRSCPKMNVSVVGGISKLYNHFKKLYNPKEIFSYADFNKFDGHGYAALGMELIGYTGPDMKWLIGNEVVNRNPNKNAELKKLAKAQLFGAGSKKYLWKAE